MSPRPRILSVIGARPEIIQAAPVSAALAGHAEEILVHTGPALRRRACPSAQILATALPHPRYNLGVGSRPREEQLALGQERLARGDRRERPDAVVVRGDTNATLSGARAAVAAGIPLVHVEAGLRSYREGMPEERNRVETDRLADLLFAPTRARCANLDRRGRRAGAIHVTGDPLCDMLESLRDEVVPAAGDYVLATVHRNYNTDDPDAPGGGARTVSAARLGAVVFPVHPRTRAQIGDLGLELPANVELVEPVPYTRMLAARARRAGDRDRLRRGAARGLPVGRAAA